MPESRMSRLSNQYHDWARSHPTAAVDFRTAIEDLLNDAGIIFDRVSTCLLYTSPSPRDD